MMAAEVTRIGGLDMQVCVPEDWSDEQVIEFAERENPWFIRREESEFLAGAPERTPCEQRDGHVHITLDA